MGNNGVNDNEALELLQEKYQDILERDPLTGIYNRRGFYNHTYNMLHDNLDTVYDICCVNIDKFKVVNDLFGTFAGDKLLNFLAKKFRECYRSKGTYARITADNFAICIPHTDNIYEEVTETIQRWLEDYPLAIRIITRCGFYHIHDIDVPVSLMCDRANLAILEIKGSYDKHFSLYDDNIRKKILQEQEIINEMKAALDDRQFVVYYQPKVNMESGKVIGSEALVRWMHPEKGMISPGVFIPIFEKNGFISSLDRYVWEAVCQDIRSWIREGYVVCPVSVNVSRAELYNRDLAYILSAMLDKYEVPIEYLQLEITESAYTDNPDQLIEIVNELKEMGFVILMDDFGSGYSSLNTLKDVPVDVLKLDLKFLYNMDQNLKANYILKSVVQMAKRLNLVVIAEGVETETQAEFLKSIGCVRAQGYLYAKPMPRRDLEGYLSDPKKVSENDEVEVQGLVNIDDVLSTYHREDELEWYRSAVVQLGAMITEYDIENDMFSLFDMKLEKDAEELSRVEVSSFMKVVDNGELVYPEDAAEIIDMLKTGKRRPVNLRVRRSYGSIGYRWYSYDGRVQYTSDGKEKSVVGVLQDISEKMVTDTVLKLMERFENTENIYDNLRMALQDICYGMVADSCYLYFVKAPDGVNPGGMLYNRFSGYTGESDEKALDEILIGVESLHANDSGIITLSRKDFDSLPETIRNVFFAHDEKNVILKKLVYADDIVIIFGLSNSVMEKTYDKDSFRRFSELVFSFGNGLSQTVSNLKEKQNYELYSTAFAESRINFWEWNVRTKTLRRSKNVSERDHAGEYITNVPDSVVEAGIIHPDYVQAYIDAYKSLEEGKDAVVMAKRLLKDGAYHWLRIVYHVIKGADGKPVKAIGFGDNVNAIYDNQLHSRQRIRMGLEGDEKRSWFSVDLTEDKIVDWSSSLKGIKYGDSYNDTVDIMAKTIVLPEYVEKFIGRLSRSSLLEAFKDGRQCVCYHYKYRSGANKDEIHIREIHVDLAMGDDGHVSAFVFFQNVDEREKYIKLVDAYSDWDEVNWLAGSEPFNDMLRKVIDQEIDDHGALVLVDMDKFTMIQEVFGHAYANEIINSIVASIKANIPTAALMGRIFSDRFAIYLPNYESRAQIFTLTNAIQKSIYSAFSINNEVYVLSASVGVKFIEDYKHDYDGLMRATLDELAKMKSLGV